MTGASTYSLCPQRACSVKTCTNCLSYPLTNPKTNKPYSKCDRCRERQKETDRRKYMKHGRHVAKRIKEAGLCRWGSCKNKTEINITTGKPRAYCNEHNKRSAKLMSRWQKNNRNLTHKHRKTCEQKLKDKFFEMYGRACACCSESNPLFMTLDHVQGDGHRSRSKGRRLSPYYYYREAVKSYKPERFQTLCFNCNCAKRNKSSCPCRSLQYCSDYEDIREG